MSSSDGRREPELPRVEPEIIPPEGATNWRARGSGRRENVFVYMDAAGNTRRINIKPISPLLVVLVLLAIAIVGATVFAVVVGALVFLVPLAALALAALIGFFYARGLWQRLTGSWGSSRRG